MNLLRLASRALATLLLTLGLPLSAHAEFDEGIDYKTVPIAGPRDGKTIEVLEFFYYGCPHCDRLQPHLKAWTPMLGENVRFERMPAALNARWTLYARAFYAAEALGVLEQGHQALFDALHRKNQRLTTQEELADFWTRHGADRERFLALMRDFNVDRKVRRSASLARRYGLEGVPALVIDGRWLTSPGITGSQERTLEVADYLIAKARNMR